MLSNRDISFIYGGKNMLSTVRPCMQKICEKKIAAAEIVVKKPCKRFKQIMQMDNNGGVILLRFKMGNYLPSSVVFFLKELNTK